MYNILNPFQFLIIALSLQNKNIDLILDLIKNVVPNESKECFRNLLIDTLYIRLTI